MKRHSPWQEACLHRCPHLLTAGSLWRPRGMSVENNCTGTMLCKWSLTFSTREIVTKYGFQTGHHSTPALPKIRAPVVTGEWAPGTDNPHATQPWTAGPWSTLPGSRAGKQLPAWVLLPCRHPQHKHAWKLYIQTQGGIASQVSLGISLLQKPGPSHVH